jgi:ATP-binding cassette subfamily B multidrug efflux pump
MSGAPEESLGRAYDARLIRRLWQYIRPYRGTFVLSVACMPLVLVFTLAQPYLLKVAIDRYVAHGLVGGLALMAGLYLATLAGEFAAAYWQYFFTMQVAQRSLADLRVHLFSHVQRLPMAYFDRNPVGRLVTRMTTDVDVLNEMFAAGGMTIFMDVLNLVGIVVIMLVIDVRLTVVSLALLPVLLLAVNFFRIAARRTYRLIRERIARINAFLQEAISGMLVVQLFAREGRTFGEFDGLNAAHRDANHQSNRYEAALFSLVEAFETLSKALILWYASRRMLGDAVTIGTIFAFSEYVQKLFIPVRDFSAKYAVMQSAMAAGERVFQLLDTPVAPGHAARGGRAPAAVRGAIEFDHVWFAYRGEDWVLRDVSFRVTPGQKIALVGATGSGKTTITKLLGRFYEVGRGRVLVDGIDVREWDVAALRRAIGVVLQDVFLFTGDVADNIALGDPAIPEAAIREAAALVNADRVIARLPRGLREPIRERGNNLSVGERQLLAFARAVAHDPTILVLDEATSSIDTETEALIQEGLVTLMRGRTAVAIAHRLSTIESADRILVLHRGELREEGTHPQLLARGGVYSRLWRLQYELAGRGEGARAGGKG